jgi:hypothetical protein
MAGRPFILLGVSADRSREQLKRAQETHEITWRSWFDGRHGPIGDMYRVQFFPTLYLIDHSGVIRKIYIGDPPDSELDQDVEQLIEETEEDARIRRAEPP